MKHFIIIATFFVGFGQAFAAGAPGAGGWTGAAGLSVGAGETKDKDGSLPKTDMLYTEASFQFGYSFGTIAPIAQVGFRYLGQRTNSDEVNGNNVGGSGYTGGVGVRLASGAVRFAAIYDLLAKFDLANATSGGAKVSYGKASGFHVSLGYQWKPMWELNFSYSVVDYKQKTVNSSDVDLADNPISQTLYGVGIAYLF